MPTFLQGIAKKAQEQPKHRFGSLYELLNERFLKECWRGIRKDAAYGVDRVSAQLDLWFHKVVKPRCGGEACLIRYADDYSAMRIL